MFGLLFVMFGFIVSAAVCDVSHITDNGYNGKSRETVYRIVHEYAQNLQNMPITRNYLPPIQSNHAHANNFAQNSIEPKEAKIKNYEVGLPDLDLRPPKPMSFNTAPNFNQIKVNNQNPLPQNNVFQGPAYLPPLPSQQKEHVQSPPEYVKGSVLASFQAPKYLPPGYEPKNPNDQQYRNLESENEKVNKVQDNHSAYQLSIELPEGYDFVKPAGAEAAIAELHTLPNDEPRVKYEPTYQSNGYGKIRTVQILNDATIKTWKVLETDQAGIKTIKILGHSHENPMGEHHVINIEFSGAQTQTVKLYNDHKLVNLTGGKGNNHLPNNDYLPPSKNSHVNHKRSLRVATESYLTSLSNGYHTNVKI